MTFEDDEPYDSNQLPWISAYGEPGGSVLHARDLEAWAANRARACGHRQLNERCRWCQGTLKAVDAFAAGSMRIRVLPRN